MDIDDDNAIITSVTTRIDNPKPSMALPNQPSPMKKFEATWSAQEKADDLCDWTRPRIAEFIQASASTIESFFEKPSDAASKCMVMLSMRMREAGLSRFEFDARMQGSKFMIESEHFRGSVELVPTGKNAEAPLPEPNSSSSVMELAEKDEQTLEPAQKIGKIWNDAQGSLAIYDQIRSAFGDKEGTRSAQDAALLLIHFELTSLVNAHEANMELSGLSDTDDQGQRVDTGLDSMVKTVRVETRMPALAAPRTRM